MLARRQFGILFSSSSYFFLFLVKVLDRSFVIFCWYRREAHLFAIHIECPISFSAIDVSFFDGTLIFDTRSFNRSNCCSVSKLTQTCDVVFSVSNGVASITSLTFSKESSSFLIIFLPGFLKLNLLSKGVTMLSA